jgi:hypothetical protein
VSSRITVQKGLFTVHPIPERPLEQWHMRVDKLVVAAGSRVTIRNELRRLGVDRGSLFPDLDGIASALNARSCVVEGDELRERSDPPGGQRSLAYPEAAGAGGTDSD